MQQNLIIPITVGSHHSSTDLTEPYSVSPTGSVDIELLWNAGFEMTLFYNKRTAVKMRFT